VIVPRWISAENTGSHASGVACPVNQSAFAGASAASPSRCRAASRASQAISTSSS
jgi:hypothetical protein